MDETNRHFELRFTGDKLPHPNGPYTIYRSDEMIGNGGRVWVSNFLTHAVVEVSYRDLSLFRLHDILVEGIPVVRIRRALNGNIVGEWVHPAADRAAISPPRAAPPRAAEGETGTTQPESGTALSGALQWAGTFVNRSTGAGALQLAGALLSRSSGNGWQALGSFLSSVSREMSQPSEPEKMAGDVAPKSPAEVEPVVASLAEPGAIPTQRSCEGCAQFRPHVRISQRLTEELGPSISEEVVGRALNELVSQEEKGKGEEARRLADLYRQGKDRWGNRPPSFFSYCAAHERDQREPTIFIAQIRNADHRCRPVKRAGGQRWNDAPTDFSPNAPIAHGCSTCAHRIRATGPGEDAREIREIVSQASYVSSLSAAVGHKGTDASSLLSSYPDMKRKNAATARAREIAEVFARRGSDSHASTEPRYLDRCGLKSDPRVDRYRVCAVENPHDRCPDWTPV